MPESTLEMTKDLVVAQIQSDNMSPEDVNESTRRIFESLLALKSREESEFPVSAAVSITPRAPTDWRQSITRHSIACLECGAQLRQLNGRHLQQHGLDTRSYRAKYGIPYTQSLAAKETTARRRKITQETRLWEKTLRHRRAQERDGKAPAEEARAASEAAKAPAAATPATPKRARKTAPKKTARKKSTRG